VRLTRGCRAGGGVACPSLEYGGMRAATRRTPAPRDCCCSSPSARPPPPPPSPPRPLPACVPPTFPSPTRPCSYSPRNVAAGPGTALFHPFPSPFAVASLMSAPATATTTTTTTTMFPHCCRKAAHRLTVRPRQSDRERGGTRNPVYPLRDDASEGLGGRHALSSFGDSPKDNVARGLPLDRLVKRLNMEQT